MSRAACGPGPGPKSGQMLRGIVRRAYFFLAFFPILGKRLFTAALTFFCSAGEPCCATRANAFRACALSGIGYFRLPGRANDDLLNLFRSLVFNSLAIFRCYPAWSERIGLSPQSRWTRREWQVGRRTWRPDPDWIHGFLTRSSRSRLASKWTIPAVPKLPRVNERQAQTCDGDGDTRCVVPDTRSGRLPVRSSRLRPSSISGLTWPKPNSDEPWNHYVSTSGAERLFSSVRVPRSPTTS